MKIYIVKLDSLLLQDMEIRVQHIFGNLSHMSTECLNTV